ncbi:ASC1-like protein 3 [Platanthera guangdongensis]|uniref:ASC1-like protein 3 n=1 Tax=Platanthera guangdongensis TaxID=2320717 RepID=A0ABR2LSF3_9ASPA
MCSILQDFMTSMDARLQDAEARRQDVMTTLLHKLDNLIAALSPKISPSFPPPLLLQSPSSSTADVPSFFEAIVPPATSTLLLPALTPPASPDHVPPLSVPTPPPSTPKDPFLLSVIVPSVTLPLLLTATQSDPFLLLVIALTTYLLLLLNTTPPTLPKPFCCLSFQRLRHYSPTPPPFFRIGTVILALHDASDVFLEGAKIFKYAEKEMAASLFFAFFALSWLLLRLFFFPFWIIRASSYYLIETLSKVCLHFTLVMEPFPGHSLRWDALCTGLPPIPLVGFVNCGDILYGRPFDYAPHGADQYRVMADMESSQARRLLRRMKAIDLGFVWPCGGGCERCDYEPLFVNV